jgi:hypothetical protein
MAHEDGRPRTDRWAERRTFGQHAGGAAWTSARCGARDGLGRCAGLGRRAASAGGGLGRRTGVDVEGSDVAARRRGAERG